VRNARQQLRVDREPAAGDGMVSVRKKKKKKGKKKKKIEPEGA
jgi:hypothetical protein